MESGIWKDIPGYEGAYEISDAGTIRRSSGSSGTYKGRVLHPGLTVWGYRQAHLSLDGKVTPHSVHSLVMLTFVGPRPEGYEINHINGDKQDNRIENLQYVTKSQNRLHAFEIGLQDTLGEHNSQNKLTAIQVLQIREMCATGKYLHRELADIFNVTRRTIGDIVQRRSWKHI